MNRGEKKKKKKWKRQEDGRSVEGKIRTDSLWALFGGYNDAFSRAEVGKSRLVDNAIVLMGRERQVKLPF